MSPTKTRTIAFLEPPIRTTLQFARYSAAALESLGHRVHSLLYKEDRLARRLGLPFVADAEQAWSRRGLLAWLEKIEPELILVIRALRIAPSTIEWIRRRLRVSWACWSYGNPLDVPPSTMLSPYYDYFFTADPHSARAHRDAGSPNVGVLPYACHPPLHRPVTLTPEERAALQCDIAFGGTINAAHRRDVLEAVAAADVDLKVWGGLSGMYRDYFGTEVHGDLRFSNALQRRLVGHWAWQEELSKIYSTAGIVLNVVHPDVLNLRLFEAPGCGAFLLTDGREYVGEFFEPGKEVALYDGPEDVAEKVAYWLARPGERASIAEAGRRRAHCDHTYVNRMQVLVETCFGPEAARGPSP